MRRVLKARPVRGPGLQWRAYGRSIVPTVYIPVGRVPSRGALVKRLRLGRCPISANLFIDVFRAAPYSPGMATVNAAQEDWNVLVSFFPSNWKQLAQATQALKGLRQDKSE